MKKNYLPILLLVGAGIAAFMLLRKRKEDETLPADEDQEPTVTKPEVSFLPKLISTSAADTIRKALQAKKEGGAIKTSLVSSAVKARKEAIKKAQKQNIPKKTGAAIVKALSQGIRIKGFDDNNVLV